MRARSREINIFNMSLLDILTGMLGAFLFLMLGLVPYYTKAKAAANQQGSSGPSTPHVDTLLNVIGQWGSQANISLYLYDPTYGWSGVNSNTAPLPSGTKVDSGACNGDTGWQNVATFAVASGRYLVAYSVQGDVVPANYSQLNLSISLISEQSKTDGSGVQNFCPLILCPSYNPSGSKPNVMYGICWITVTQDASKGEYYRQWSFTAESATDTGADAVPKSVSPMPSPLVAYGPPPLGPVAAPTPAPGPAPIPPPAPAASHNWFFDWFHSSSSK
jgi:hypothetical protein